MAHLIDNSKGINTYTKFCPNVFVAKCEKEHTKGDVIILTTKHGKEIENEVHNYVGKTRDGFFLYSVIRLDGFNAQERAAKKAEKLNQWAGNAAKRSDDYYKKADLSEEATGIPFGQPILVGHHSERAHRGVIERADSAMRKSIQEGDKAEEYSRRAAYWEGKINDINLSMPESIEFYRFKIEETEKHHQDLKDHPEKRPHSLALTYANKAVKEAKSNYDLAVRLWG